mgnify:FL=1|tara:strand:+ start:42 stop:260 length:219 start_codon:yes stop_codon:yes gene_type:complete
MSEPLDLKNVFEIERIRNILIEHPDLLAMFEILIVVANRRLNDEKPSLSLPLEDNEEIHLSDHESDETSDDD